jgi:hypothetical protein
LVFSVKPAKFLAIAKGTLDPASVLSACAPN